MVSLRDPLLDQHAPSALPIAFEQHTTRQNVDEPPYPPRIIQFAEAMHSFLGGVAMGELGRRLSRSSETFECVGVSSRLSAGARLQ